MNAVDLVQARLSEFRDGLVADGYDLEVEGVVGGSVSLRIVAGPGACPDCLVPKAMMVPLLEAELAPLASITRVDVSYPTE